MLKKRRRQSVSRAKEGKAASYTKLPVIFTDAQELERIMRVMIAAELELRSDFLDIAPEGFYERVQSAGQSASAVAGSATSAAEAMRGLQQILERQELNRAVSAGLADGLRGYPIGGTVTGQTNSGVPNPSSLPRSMILHDEFVMSDIDYASLERNMAYMNERVVDQLGARELTITVDEAQIMAYAANLPTFTPKAPPNHSTNMARKNRNSVWPKKPLPVHMRPKED